MKNPPPIPDTEDTNIVKLHPESSLAKQAAKDLAANARLHRVSETQRLAEILQMTLGPAFSVRAA